jgi:phosphoglycolate phosphatase-like HAD superfamily hydrolase
VRHALFLFDIDGTLIHAGGAGRRALEGAMEDHLGGAVKREEPWLGRLKLDGMTDRLIVREAVVALGRRFDQALCDRILASYAERLEGEIGGPGYEVLPGVESALRSLSARGIAFGLCTGNIARGARIKLRRGGLDRWFGFGDADPNGFAEDGEAREHIVAAALRRASTRLGRALRPEEALVIGDTPRDVAAARAVGCPVLAVATGRFGVAELRREGAEFAAPSLASPEAEALLLGS